MRLALRLCREPLEGVIAVHGQDEMRKTWRDRRKKKI